MKYLIKNNNTISFLTDELHDIPDDAIEISDDKWMNYLENQSTLKWDDVAQDFINFEYVKTVEDLKLDIKQNFETSLDNGFMSSTNILLDSRFEDIQKLDAGLRLAQKLSLTNMNVRDKLNVTHDLTVEAVDDLIIELGVNYQTLLSQKWEDENNV